MKFRIQQNYIYFNYLQCPFFCGCPYAQQPTRSPRQNLDAYRMPTGIKILVEMIQGRCIGISMMVPLGVVILTSDLHSPRTSIGTKRLLIWRCFFPSFLYVLVMYESVLLSLVAKAFEVSHSPDLLAVIFNFLPFVLISHKFVCLQ